METKYIYSGIKASHNGKSFEKIWVQFDSIEHVKRFRGIGSEEIKKRYTNEHVYKIEKEMDLEECE